MTNTSDWWALTDEEVARYAYLAFRDAVLESAADVGGLAPSICERYFPASWKGLVVRDRGRKPYVGMLADEIAGDLSITRDELGRVLMSVLVTALPVCNSSPAAMEFRRRHRCTSDTCGLPNTAANGPE